MQIWHLRFSSDGRHPLFPEERTRRAAVLVLVRHAGPWLVTFGVVDDHLHVVVVCSRARAGKLSRALLLGLRPLAELGFEPSFLKPVESRSHLLRLMGYCIEQPAKHGLPEHPARWSGSAFSDLVGARAIEGMSLRVVDVLPRYRLADAWRAAGLPTEGLAPATDAEILGWGLTALCSAASFSLCADPEPGGGTSRDTRARAVVVQLGRRAGFRVMDIAAALGVSAEAVRKLGHRAEDGRAHRATRLRLAIQVWVAAGPNQSQR